MCVCVCVLGHFDFCLRNDAAERCISFTIFSPFFILVSFFDDASRVSEFALQTEMSDRLNFHDRTEQSILTFLPQGRKKWTE